MSWCFHYHYYRLLYALENCSSENQNSWLCFFFYSCLKVLVIINLCLLILSSLKKIPFHRRPSVRKPQWTSSTTWTRKWRTTRVFTSFRNPTLTARLTLPYVCAIARRGCDVIASAIPNSNLFCKNSLSSSNRKRKLSLRTSCKRPRRVRRSGPRRCRLRSSNAGSKSKLKSRRLLAGRRNWLPPSDCRPKPRATKSNWSLRAKGMYVCVCFNCRRRRRRH